MAQQHPERHVVKLTGKRPRLPSYTRSSRSVEIEQLQHVSDEQRAEIAKQVDHADAQIELTNQYPGRRR